MSEPDPAGEEAFTETEGDDSVSKAARGDLLSLLGVTFSIVGEVV